MRKILHRKESGTALRDGNAHSAQVGTENVRAMSGGMHPHIVDDSGIRADGDVLGDDAEVGPCVAKAREEGGLTGKLMRHLIELRHAASVLTSGGSKSGVPLKNREAQSGAFTVQGVEKLTLRASSLRRPSKQGPRSHQKDGKDENSEARTLPHAILPRETGRKRSFPY